MNTAEIKQKANELSELCIRDGAAFADEYAALYESGEYTEKELDIVLKLSDLYTEIKQGHMTREEGIKEQKFILSSGKNGRVSTIE